MFCLHQKAETSKSLTPTGETLPFVGQRTVEVQSLHLLQSVSLLPDKHLETEKKVGPLQFLFGSCKPVPDCDTPANEPFSQNLFDEVSKTWLSRSASLGQFLFNSLIWDSSKNSQPTDFNVQNLSIYR